MAVEGFLSQQEIDEQMERLRRSFGVDRGLFVVALHAFMEMYMNLLKNDFLSDGGFDADGRPVILPFGRKLDLYREFLAECFGPSPWYDGFRAIGREHRLTNQVRHYFHQLSEEEVMAALANFRSFCMASRLSSPFLNELETRIQGWRDRLPPLDADRILVELQAKVQHLEGELASSNEQRMSLQESARQVDELRRRLAQQDEELLRLSSTAEKRGGRIDELRKERHELAGRLKEAQSGLVKMEQYRRSREALLRLSILTRSRRDFERHMLRLSREQAQVLSGFKTGGGSTGEGSGAGATGGDGTSGSGAKVSANGGDFLVRGSAGSGKTVVLLEALRQILEGEGSRAADSGSEFPAFLLLTYTRTLVRYNRYVSSILHIESAHLTMETADAFLLKLWKRFSTAPGRERYRGTEFLYRADERRTIFELMEDSGRELPLNAEALFTEVDSFLWAYHVSRSEYVDDMLPRSGLSGRLGREQRQELWDWAEYLEDVLVEGGLLTRNLACRIMLESLSTVESGVGGAGSGAGETGTAAANETADVSAGAGPGFLPRFEAVFVDEVQDLPPVVLALLKRMSARLVMAGDASQSIYGPVSPLKRAGIDIRGRSRVLRMNFRNTIPMLDCAEAFRRRSGLIALGISGAEGGGVSAHSAGTSDEAPTAFRTGPPVGAWLEASDAAARKRLFERVDMYLRELEYEPENVCVLAPAWNVLGSLKSELESSGVPAVLVVSREAEGFAQGTGFSGRGGDEEFDFALSRGVRLSTLHSAKGLDFPVVIVFLPFSVRLGWMERLSADQAHATMSSLLYVSLTRALDHLEVITGPGFGGNDAERALVETLAELREQSAGQGESGVELG